jgi:saccharopine dehydrogenase-like NADP-dependent oxidoreductase
MHEILVLGAGHIGTLVATLLALTGDYRVHLADAKSKPLPESLQNQFKMPIECTVLDIDNDANIDEYVKRFYLTAVISCLPYFCNPTVATIAKRHHLHYFDLTEDIQVTQQINQIAKGQKIAFVPQCGLAPGFVSIAAQELMSHFDTVQTVAMRVGALPVHPNNILKYALTWSTDGLINQCSNIGYGILNSKIQPLQPLEGLETIDIDGALYEAFNTSGGIGTLANTHEGHVEQMTYKSLRYPEHCRYLKFLMQDLGLNQDRALLKEILERALPKTAEDVAVIYIVVTGQQRGQYREESYVRKIYSQMLAQMPWTAIQITTASSVCAVVDMVLDHPENYHGVILQEQFSLTAFLNNRFGKIYQ